MAGTDEQFGPAFELLPRLSYVRDDQAIDAAGILVNAINNVRCGARIDIDMKGAEQAPMTACYRCAGDRLKAFAETSGESNVIRRNSRIRTEKAGDRTVKI